MSEPQSVQPASPANTTANGSLGLGIALAWACLIGGYVLVAAIATTLFSVTRGMDSNVGATLAIGLSALPWIAMFGLIVYFLVNNKPRTAVGVAVGFASILGVGLLLVAACFGLLATSNFH